MALKGNDLVLGEHPDGQPIVLGHDARLEHASFVGATGCGKSRLVEGCGRQDLKHHSETGCGFMVIDPHGDVFDGLMAYVAANGLDHLPIVPIDLRSDQIISYNVLRQRTKEPSVFIENLIKMFVNVWGAENTDATPLLERWGINSLHRLYDEKKTLADICQFFTPEGLIDVEQISDPVIRSDWRWARTNLRMFVQDTRSFVNRIRRFVLPPKMRAMFGQTDVSLDFNRVLDEGQILLVCLSRAGGHISQGNADLLGTLFQTDFWMAAEERGVSDSNRPYYLYLDEAQRFLTPAMAESMAEARGFGVGMTLINQFPRQMLNAGPYGQRIYDEIRENCRTKVVFRQRARENLEIAADELFLKTYDPLIVKHQHYATRMVDQRVEYLPSYGVSATATTGGGTTHSHMHGITHAVASQWSHTETDATALTHSSTATVGASATDSTERSETIGRTKSNIESGGTSKAASRSHGTTANASTNENMGIAGQNILPKDASGNQALGFQDQVEAGETDQSWSRGIATGTGTSNATASTEAQTTGWNRATSANVGASLGESHAKSLTTSLSDGTAATATASVADTVGGSKSIAVSDAETFGENSNWSNAKSQTVSWAPVVFSVLGKEADQPVFLSVDDQKILAMQEIFCLQNREAFVLTSDMNTPVLFRTRDVNRPDVSRVRIEVAVAYYQQECGLALPFDTAIKRVRDRDREWEGGGALEIADADFAPSETEITVVTATRVRRK